MSITQRSALIAGASGLVGGHCLRKLLERPEYERVVAIGRRRTDLSHPKLTQHIVDFESFSAADCSTVDDVYCCLGTTIAKAGSKEAFARVDREYPRRLAEAAFNSGAEQFLLVSSVGADAQSSNFYLRTKGEVEQSVSGVPFTAVHIFRPSMLLGKRTEFRWKERVSEPLVRGMQWMFVGSLGKYRPIEAEAVARAMVNAALSASEGVQIYQGERLEQIAEL